MKLLKLFIFTSLVLLIVSCGSTNIPLQPVPLVNKVAPPAPPNAEHMPVTLSYPAKGKDEKALEENTTVKGRFSVPLNAKVVISVPVEQQDYRGNPISQESDNADNVFQTAEYFNKAEQEIEKSLLRKGFTVLDRSKFEAELRNRRTEERSLMKTEAMRQEIKSLEEQRDAKRITREEYIEKLRDVESKYEVIEKTGGHTAGKKELVDIGELIRAAEKGSVQADFILQVNRFEIGQISDKRVYLPDHFALEEIVKRDLNLLKTLEKEDKASITQPGYFGYLNAKLIEVKTGSIVWVGEHRVESADATDIKVEMDINKVAANTAAVNAIAQNFNRKLDSINAEIRKYERIVNNQDADIDVRNRAKANYDKLVAQLSNMDPTNLTYPAWQYAYQVSKPNIRPSFPSANELRELKTLAKKTGNYNPFLRQQNYAIEHQSDLAKTVSKELISTIPASEE